MHYTSTEQDLMTCFLLKLFVSSVLIFDNFLILVFTFSNVHYTNKKNNLDYFKDLTDIQNILTQHSYTLIWTSRKNLIYAKLLLQLCDSVDPLVSIMFFKYINFCLTINICIKNIVLFHINVCLIDTNSCSFFI